MKLGGTTSLKGVLVLVWYARVLIQILHLFVLYTSEEDLCIIVKLHSGNRSRDACRKTKKCLLPVAVTADIWLLRGCQKDFKIL